MHFSLFLATLCLFLPHSAWVRGDCPPCNEQNCPPVACRVPELLARDECACCPQCLSLEGEPCGGRGQGRARCAAGLVCVSHSAGDAEEQSGSGLCVCKEDSAVCGSDGSSHRSVCALHLHSWEAQRAGRDRIHKAHDGECKLGVCATFKELVLGVLILPALKPLTNFRTHEYFRNETRRVGYNYGCIGVVNTVGHKIEI